MAVSQLCVLCLSSLRMNMLICAAQASLCKSMPCNPVMLLLQYSSPHLRTLVCLAAHAARIATPPMQRR